MIQNFSSLKITLLTAFLLVYGCKKNETSTPIPKTPEGMIWVPKKTFLQGAKETDKYGAYAKDASFVLFSQINKPFVPNAGYLR